MPRMTPRCVAATSPGGGHQGVRVKPDPVDLTAVFTDDNFDHINRRLPGVGADLRPRHIRFLHQAQFNISIRYKVSTPGHQGNPSW